MRRTTLLLLVFVITFGVLLMIALGTAVNHYHYVPKPVITQWEYAPNESVGIVFDAVVVDMQWEPAIFASKGGYLLVRRVDNDEIGVVYVDLQTYAKLKEAYDTKSLQADGPFIIGIVNTNK